ncbi:MAG: ImmA/IrrE family metallo-endopeptidase [Candidatus Magasanikbacteria bacterium]|nr:ImmA/IrrE family metallo-endopeptidase [Candidatus Magasanikbacteria bacterium]
MSDYEKAQVKAKELLEEHNITTPVVPIFDFTQRFGFKIFFFKPEKIDGEKLNDVAGFTDLDQKIIYINEHDPSYRQSFTVAHELGHIVLEHQPSKVEVQYLYRNTNITTTDEEKEANVFAANLLMPKIFIEKIMKQYNLHKEDVNTLAGIFGVSPQAMNLRLKYL